MTPDRQIDELVRRLAPRIDPAPAAADPHNPTARELLAVITSPGSTPLTVPAVPALPEGRRPWRSRRLTLVGAAAAVGMSVAAAGAVIAWPSSPTTPAPAEANVLDFTTDGDVVVARVTDPTADPARYAAEFAEHGLDVDLRFVPAPPSVVGTVIYLDPNRGGTGTDRRPVETIEAEGECVAPGLGSCPVGIRIPEDYGNPIEVVFGRAAEPGEAYDAMDSATGPGGALEGLDLEGTRVSAARDALAERDQRATQFRWLEPGTDVTVALTADEVPGDWYVYDVALYAPGEVVLFVGETRVPPVPAPPEHPPTTPPSGEMGPAGGGGEAGNEHVDRVTQPL